MVNSFIKWESYGSIKHARIINSRSDEFKCTVGPIFRLIEKEVFENDWFIKKIPVTQRCDYIVNRLLHPGQRYYSSDYTSFEALFTREMMMSCEWELYDYMTSVLPEHDEFMWYYDHVIAGRQKMKNPFVTAWVDATRMSGEMNTSLGNGHANKRIMQFVAELSGAEVLGVVEGDDGLFCTSRAIKEELFADMGLRVKLETHVELTSASFCGIVCDVEARQVVTDPFPILAEFGWVNSRYMGAKTRKLHELLKVKAMSLIYEYPNCPIVSQLAMTTLRLLRATRVQIQRYLRAKDVNSYERYFLEEMWPHMDELYSHRPTVHPSTRLLFEDLYKISVAEQLKLERMLQDKENLGPIEYGLDFPPVWREYYEKYWAYAWETVVDELPGVDDAQRTRAMTKLSEIARRTGAKITWAKQYAAKHSAGGL